MYLVRPNFFPSCDKHVNSVHNNSEIWLRVFPALKLRYICQNQIMPEFSYNLLLSAHTFLISTLTFNVTQYYLVGDDYQNPEIIQLLTM